MFLPQTSLFKSKVKSVRLNKSNQTLNYQHKKLVNVLKQVV